MANIKINITELKDIVGKLNLAIEKTKINPKSGWIELESDAVTNTLTIKVGNYDYYLESSMSVTGSESLHATITADTFVPLISKLDAEEVTFSEHMNALILTTDTGEYTFPVIKELDKVRSVDSIAFDADNFISTELSGIDIASVADTNAKGLADSVFSKDIQQFIYMDNEGALTFTENIYINKFQNPAESSFKILLNGTQAKLLKAFESFEKIIVNVESSAIEEPKRVEFSATDKSTLTLVLITQPVNVVEKFPSLKIRGLADAVSETHAVVDKKAFEKALSRLMVFDKKFDITVLNYSKLVFGKDSVKLVSIKNKNYEIVPYISGANTIEHESMIRFADIINQLKAITTKEVDISYGNSPAITLNGNIKQLIPEIQVRG